MENTATKESWKNIPIVTPKLINIYEITPDLKLFLSEDQYIKIKEGLIPEAMEDKWFIYFENDWLYFHRSWTGNGIFKVEIIKEKGDVEDREYKIKEFYVERNKEIYNNENDEYDLDVLLQLILWGLLRLDVRNIFFEKYGSDEKETIKIWSEFGRLFINVDEMKEGKNS
jgi:hypothetical protein